ncbi:MAG TPA: diguanylate cyclase [Gemmatimonadaceae bacterium]|nr:diguanylate cyclase [Gemmatimonadaceae bacterium]
MMIPPEHDAREAVLNVRFQAWSTSAALIVTMIGTAVLVGWALEVEFLKRVVPSFRAMDPASAAAFILCGFSLALLRESRLTPQRRTSALILGVIVVFIGSANFIGAMTTPGFGLDHYLFGSFGFLHQKHDEMATSTAIAFMLFGLALVYFAAAETQLGHRLSQLCSTAGTVIALVSFLAYLYGADMEQGFGALVPMAVHTALSFVVLGTGLLIAPGTQAIKLVSRSDQGGQIVRRFFPSVVVTIIALGYLGLQGQQAGWYQTEMGVALLASGSIVALAALLWWNAALISSADRRRLAIESALHLSESALRAANEALALQVRTDSLTGVRNRMALDEELKRATLNLQRYEREPFSVVMIDVDYFKRYNDTFGHLAGDEVLRGIAELLESTCRATDIVGRYGGEEFAIILPHTIGPGAREIAERLRATVERKKWPHAPVTVSVGIATASPATADADTVLNEADVALYLAKQGGRNRVCCAGDQPLAIGA